MNAGQDSTMIAIHESALSKIGDVLITLQDETIKRLSDATEAAEARAAQLETDNDEMQSYINDIRVALHTEKDELTIDAVRRVISERDDLRAKLDQAQRKIEAYDKADRALNQVLNEGDGVYRP